LPTYVLKPCKVRDLLADTRLGDSHKIVWLVMYLHTERGQIPDGQVRPGLSNVLARTDLSPAAKVAWQALHILPCKGKFRADAELAKICGWKSASKAKRIRRELQQHGL
jgi:hypothetical protein